MIVYKGWWRKNPKMGPYGGYEYSGYFLFGFIPIYIKRLG